MATIKQSDFDKLVAHTIRIELMNGHTLIYQVGVESKTALYKLLKMDAISDIELSFIWFHIPQDRLVLVNKNEIIRISFCFDHVQKIEPKYRDNFGITNTSDKIDDFDDIEEKETGENIALPQLIIMHQRQLEDTEFVEGVTMKTEGYFGNISSYSSLGVGDVEGFDFEYFVDEEEWVLLTYKYLQFIDDDGEDNFMPINNLSVIEIERSLLMSDVILDQYLERQRKKQNRTKKR